MAIRDKQACLGWHQLRLVVIVRGSCLSVVWILSLQASGHSNYRLVDNSIISQQKLQTPAS